MQLSHFEDDRVVVRKRCVGPWENNAYAVICRTTGISVLVDAAAEPDALVELLDGSRPSAILTTHGHPDHVGAVEELRRRLGVPWHLHPADAPLVGLEPDEPLLPGEIVVGEVRLAAVHTPGHTPGSTCLVGDGYVLTGDTLFPGGPGATRGPGSSFEAIVASIRDRLFSLPGDTLVFPGHGLDTTIGAERPHLEEWVARGW